MSMKNNERNIFQDLPANKFHSAVFTSFTMDLSHFDNQMLRVLQEKKVCSFNILMDQRQLDKYIDFAIPSVNHVGKEYSVTGILSQGAFHPKLSFFIGEKDLLLLYGSGNLTVPGLGKNHEVFSGLYAKEEDQTQMPLIFEAWSFILRHCRNVDGYVRRRVENEIVENSSLLRQKVKYIPHSFIDIDKSLSAALLYNEENDSIFHQMVDLIPFDEISLVTVVSPYYDVEEHRKIGKWIHEDDPLIKRIWENVKDFFHYYFVDKLKDLDYWLRDIIYLLKNKEAYSNQWNLDWHILDSMKRNIPSLIKNSYALSFIDEAIIKIHGKDPGFDLKKYHEEHCFGYPKDVEDLAIKIQNEEYEKILLYVKLYQYYFNYGDIDFDDPKEVEFDKEWRHTLPIKKGTYDEISDYDEMNQLIKEYWNKIWDWMKVYGQKLND